MNETEDSAVTAQLWVARLTAPAAAAVTTLPLREPAAPALAALAAEALARQQTLLLVTADDFPLPDISNALDLNLRPLCLVLPAADYACRIALRATLSLLKSRLSRAGADAEGPAWAAQRQKLEADADLWRACLAWSERGLDRESWPAGLESLFPVRILPLGLARQLAPAPAWAVLVDAQRFPEDSRGPWPGAARTLRLEQAPGGFAGALVRADPAARQRAELDVLTQELSELELELATAQGEIAGFTRRYHAVIGSRLGILDGLRAELAAVQAAARPDDPAAVGAAREAQARAEQSQREQRAYADAEREPARPFAPSGDLKKLYRRLAQLIHPDRARSEADRAWRTQLMSEANRAYRAGDEAALREVMELWREGAAGEAAAAGSAPADGLAAQLAALKRRISEIEGELNRLFGSRLYELFTAANIARRAGRDLLQEMAERLDADIAAARDELAVATAA